jgi:glycosyltransferase involved in cell wall biosynthesis
MLVSAALIVRDEERSLGACLASLKGLADEVVVVDTGSQDRSKDIARDAGARVYERDWTSDFSAARNQALDLARGDWIFYIDADERVGAGTSAGVRARLSRPGYVGHWVLLRPRPDHTAYWEMRLFRNDPEIRFRGIIHENIWPGINVYRERRGGRIGRTRLVLEHDGYEGDQRRKHLRNQPLLERSLADDPSRVYSWCHLAGVREALGDAEGAEQAWTQALRVVRGKQSSQPEDVLPFLHLIERGLEDGDDVADLLGEALKRFSSSLHLALLHARFLMATGRAAEAIPVVEGLVEAGQTSAFEKSWSYDVRMFGVFAYAMLGACHFTVGEYAAARRYFELAAQSEPSNLEYRVKAALCARLAANG